jgi:flagellar L-ring protein precursor FlgH
LVVILLFLVLGCAGPKNGPTTLPLEPQAAGALPPNLRPEEGSLWVNRNPQGLLADLKARDVGDIVTISITETAKASNIANTDTSKTAGVKVSIGSLFGLNYPMNSFTDNSVNVENAVEAGLGNTSKGEGKTERQSTFTTFITTRVIQVLPNNQLVIQGRRNMRINNETEVVTLTGIVRSEDIDRSNIVPSTRVAEARLEIAGVGVVSDKQRQGWLTRIFDHIWPF